MGTNYGASGSSQGLSRQATRIRNQYINADNAGDRNARRRAERAFNRATGGSIGDYVERPDRRRRGR